MGSGIRGGRKEKDRTTLDAPPCAAASVHSFAWGAGRPGDGRNKIRRWVCRRPWLLVVGAGIAWLDLPSARAETGYDLWLRYVPVQDAALRRGDLETCRALVVPRESATIDIAAAELQRGLSGLLGVKVPRFDVVKVDGTLVMGTPSSSRLIARLPWAHRLEELGAEGYVIRSVRLTGHRATVIASQSEIGVLYGTFHLLRLMQTGQPINWLDVAERPRLQLRLLDHWDNLDGSIERGYAGRSLWHWAELPDKVDPRVVDYARANASIGINGTVLNSVNARPESLESAYLVKAAALARALRPYGIRVYLSANFAAPRLLGVLASADPLDPAVVAWWHEKASEIYRLIPDFGGFLVKADSEGQPGPQGYGRTHAEGANMLADAVRPFGGVVMWRAFVYSDAVDVDRVKRSYKELQPLDGLFRENVFVQVKNGPLDFQPREPFHPLFGAMPRTPLMAELQLTQEYLGQSTHLVYLAPLFKEFLDSDTYARGPGSTVARIVDGTQEGHSRTGIAGVANTGSDPNWCGNDLAQANWYAYGRLAWDPSLGAEAIAAEWIKMTWGGTREIVATLLPMMLESREAFVRYTMPLGLHHLIGGNHYAPTPENADSRRADWSATYYHRADSWGIGYDRSQRGSAAVAQYRPPLLERWSDPARCPQTLLLWFNRLPWDHRLGSGLTLWESLVLNYKSGAEEARSFERRWRSLEKEIDDERYQAVLGKLARQAAEASLWSDKCLRYFQGFSERPLTAPRDPPLKALMPPGLLIGAALNQAQSDAGDDGSLQIALRHFNSVSPENLLKWERVHPEPDRYEFVAADRFVALGESQGMAVVGHALVWHRQTPSWVFTSGAGGLADRQTLLQRMRTHILTVVGRYRTRIHGWDVVNEALNEDGTLRRSPWLTGIGEDYIEKAFEFAREADPQAELYYNDYNLWKPAKRQAALRIVKRLQRRGVRIDGVGEQGHWTLEEPRLSDFEATVEAITAAGVRVMITELDVDVLPRDPKASVAAPNGRLVPVEGTDPYRDGLPEDKQRQLARRFAEIFALVLKHRHDVSRVTFWGVTDANSWLNNHPIRGRTNHPLLFNWLGRAKPAFYSVVEELERASGEPR